MLITTENYNFIICNKTGWGGGALVSAVLTVDIHS